MNAWLMNERDWAELEFGKVDCRDERRSERLMQVAEAMALKPGEGLPAAMEGWAEQRAAYRLFGCGELTHSTLQECHCERIRRVCQQQSGRLLFIADTTTLDYTAHKATTELGGLGETGRKRGFLLHSALVVTLSDAQICSGARGLELHHHRELVGLFDQRLWKRPTTNTVSSREKKKTRWRGKTKRPRETDRWIEELEMMHPPEGAQWIYVADRESDIYECLQSAQRNGVDFVIRAARDRNLEPPLEGDLFAAAAEAPLLGTTELRLRAQAGRKARTATLELRGCTIELRGPQRPGGRLEPLTVTVIEARERISAEAAQTSDNTTTESDSDKDGDRPLHWVLLTSLPARTLPEVLEVVVIYRERWLIEDYHKALKSGTRVEHFQLRSADALERVIGIVAVLAVRLLGLQLLAAKDPQAPLPKSYADPQVLAILEARFGPPKNGWNVTEYLRAVARLGGFPGRKSDGSPGWKTIWRGVRELSSFLRLFDLLTAQKRSVQ